MKKAILYVFSGTGNTALIADLYKKYFLEYETVIYNIHKLEEGETIPLPDDFDLVGIGYPVHGFNAPQIVNDFCKALPKINVKAAAPKKTFIFKTSGEGLSFNNYSSQKIIRMMERKGYEFMTERHFVMPYNMIFRHSPQMVKSEYIYADAQVRLNVKELGEGRKNKLHYFPLRYWFVPVVRIEWLYARLQGPFMKVDMNKCTRCMKCVKECPVNNIVFNDAAGGNKKAFFKFGTDCILCVRCSFNCPQNAISIGLLNNWKINGSYHIKQTAKDEAVEFPYFTETLTGLYRWLFYKYYRRLDKELAQNGISLC